MINSTSNVRFFSEGQVDLNRIGIGPLCFAILRDVQNFLKNFPSQHRLLVVWYILANLEVF